MLIALIELGGTKTIAALGRDPLTPLATARIVTTGGEETLAEVEAFFRDAIAVHGAPAALGIASFGPVVLDRSASNWGHVARTPKPGWAGIDVAPRLGRALGCPVAFDTDVDAAALAEARLGAGRGCDPLVYLTVGTGIGGGLVVGGEIVHGLMHPEMGHLLIRRHPDDDYPGGCPHHGDCAEGLANGPSIVARFGKTLGELAGNHPFRLILADYLGQLCAGAVLITSPQRIVMGGGVMDGTGMHARVADAMRARLGRYIDAPALARPDYIVAPLYDDAGLVGAFLLAEQLARKEGSGT